MHRDWVVPGLLLLFLHGSDDVDHAFPIRGDAHLRPAMEMELSHRTRLVLLPRERVGERERGGKEEKNKRKKEKGKEREREFVFRPNHCNRGFITEVLRQAGICCNTGSTLIDGSQWKSMERQM